MRRSKTRMTFPLSLPKRRRNRRKKRNPYSQSPVRLLWTSFSHPRRQRHLPYRRIPLTNHAQRPQKRPHPRKPLHRPLSQACIQRKCRQHRCCRWSRQRHSLLAHTSNPNISMSLKSRLNRDQIMHRYSPLQRRRKRKARAFCQDLE